MASDWKRDALYLFFSKRTNRKDKENYILNAIWHRLNNMDLEPVTQQCIRLKNGKRAMIDLYFPQIKYGIECDEGYHKANTYKDLEREVSIEEVLSAVDVDKDFWLERIDATKTLNEINNDIENAVKEINKRIKKLWKPLKWKSTDERIEDVIENGKLRVEDLIPFQTEAKVGPCFNKSPKSWQKGYFALNDTYQLWFPKLALEEDNDIKAATATGWINILSDDWTSIIEYNKEHSEKMKEDKYMEKDRIVFAHSKDAYGRKAYRFIGIFHYVGLEKGRRKYQRCATEIDLTQFFD